MFILPSSQALRRIAFTMLSSWSQSFKSHDSAWRSRTDPLHHDPPCRDPQASDATSGAARDAATMSQKDDKEEQERFGTEEHTLMSEQEKEILQKLLKEFPGGSVAVQDVSGKSKAMIANLKPVLSCSSAGGCGTFFAISVESDKFQGLSRIKQHQLVNKVLADEVKTWHGVQVS